MNDVQAAVRNLLVADAALTLHVPAARIVDGYTMTEVAFPRIGLRDGGRPERRVDQGTAFAFDAAVLLQIEAKAAGRVREIAGLIIDALDTQAIEPAGFRRSMLTISDRDPIQRYDDTDIFVKFLSAQVSLQPV